MVIIGITGGMGTGKTTVAKMFAGFGAKTIDADKIAHSVIRPESDVWRKLLEAFGKEIFNKDGTINRRKLAEIVFRKEPHKLEELNSIVHPEVIDIILGRIQDAAENGADAVVIDAPLLIEAGLETVVDKLVVVTAERETQEQRSRRQLKLNSEEIRARISAQIPLSEKEKRADYIIDNNGSLENTLKQAREIWEGIK
jgi:dephospho-CoA kinase